MKLRSIDLVWTSSLCVAIHIRFHKPVFFWHLSHHKFSRNSDENNPSKPNQVAPSIHIMTELCYSSLDRWEIKIHALREMFQYSSLVKKRVKVLNAWVCGAVGMFLPSFPDSKHRICHPCHGSSSLHRLCISFIHISSLNFYLYSSSSIVQDALWVPPSARTNFHRQLNKLSTLVGASAKSYTKI